MPVSGGSDVRARLRGGAGAGASRDDSGISTQNVSEPRGLPLPLDDSDDVDLRESGAATGGESDARGAALVLATGDCVCDLCALHRSAGARAASDAQDGRQPVHDGLTHHVVVGVEMRRDRAD